jgi:drug/metabolite transporter (DMT)-like permease
MPYSGESWSLISALFWAIAVVLFRVAVKGIPAIELGLFKNTLALLLFALTWLIVPELEGSKSLTSRDVIQLFVSGFLGISLGDTLFLYSLKLLGAGRNAIISCLFSPFVILLSFIFLEEQFTFLQFLGFITILVGILLAVYQKPNADLSRNNLIKGTLVGIAAMFFMETGMVVTKPVLSDASPVSVACVRILGGVTGVFIFTIVSGRFKQSIQVYKSKLPWKAIIPGTFVGSYLALLTWIIGFKHTTASIASILNQTSVIFTQTFQTPSKVQMVSFYKTTSYGY